MGWLSAGPEGVEGSPLEVLKTSLAHLGWRIGDNLQLEERHANGESTSLPHLAAELIALRPRLIGATGATEAGVLVARTRDIPIIFMQLAVDPVAAGLVDSITRPGGNVTGFMQTPQPLWGKRLDVLREVLGRAPQRVGYLTNPRNVSFEANWVDVQHAAANIGSEVTRCEVSSRPELDSSFRVFEDCDAIMVQFDFLLVGLRQEIADLALSRRVPAIYEQRRHVTVGGLVSYGPDLTENYRQGATYVDRILKGTSISELPVVQGSRFELVINLRTAQALGLTLPPTLLARADEVIE
jgi:putative ABC transport system substrate-binding protein